MYKIVLIDSRDREKIIRQFDSYDAADNWMQRTAKRWRGLGHTIIADVDMLTTVSPHGFWHQYRIDW